MEDTRSPYCIRTPEHEAYKHALRGVGLEEFTRELCVWRPQVVEQALPITHDDHAVA